jgi:hypothetical protein
LSGIKSYINVICSREIIVYRKVLDSREIDILNFVKKYCRRPYLGGKI